ncbi:hypothetical protein [Nocardia farcinica]|uniref:hypothetical protein n=1 Tax=Nocardia farcinica TaxID=37329 RepID=UPI0037972AE7
MTAADRDVDDRQVRADRLKERIYVTFTALAVVLALRAHQHIDAGRALFTLLLTVAATLSAVFTADVVAHLVVHERLPTRAEVARALHTVAGGLGAVAVPTVFLLLAVAEVWSVHAALRACTIALIVALVAIAYPAVRRTTLTTTQRVLVLGGEAALGTAVIALQTLAHR